MKIVFFGTGSFAVPSLRILLSGRHDITALVTRPDAKKGRGYNVMPSPTKALINQAAPAIPVLQPELLRGGEITDALTSTGADVFVVIDYGKLLPENVLGIPSSTCVNLHPSLLPKYRGAAPVNHAIMAGDKATGVTLIEMTGKMDAGGILLQQSTPIGDDEDAVALLKRLSVMGAEILQKGLDLLEEGSIDPVPQEDVEVSYAPRLSKKDGLVDWRLPAEEISRKVRGLVPWPCAFTYLDGRLLKILGSTLSDKEDNAAAPGTVISGPGIRVACGRGVLEVTALQLEGKKAMPASEFLKGTRIKEGIILGK